MQKKKVILGLGLMVTLSSCWDFNRSQRFQDAENEGKSILVRAESENRRKTCY